MSANNHAVSGLLVLLLALAAPASVRAQALPDAPVSPAEERISVQLPGRTVSDVADYYEMLTGKHLIRDNQLAAAQLSIVANDVTKKQAIALIESALILNGYSIVDVDGRTAKILGPTKRVLSEGSVQLFTDPSQLPPGEEIVSYFMPFRYLKIEEAQSVFQQYAPFHPTIGNYTPVPSVNAMVITDTAALIRRLIALKDVIDIEGAKTVTEFFQLERADAEKVSELLGKLFEKGEGTPTVTTTTVAQQPNTPPVPGAPPQPPVQQAVTNIVSGPSGKIQVFPDKRTNRVMVVAPESQMSYIRSIVENLDVSVEFDEVLEKPLRFVRADEVLPVLAGVLAEGDDKAQANANAPGADPNSPNQNDQASNTSTGSNDLGGGSQAQLDVGKVDTKPLTQIVGNARIIADRSMNKIIVIGPPEARAKSARVLNMLDQRPKQVYLACVIGQLTLGDNLDVGLDYLMKFGDVRIVGQGEAGGITNLFANRNASLDLVPGTTDAVNTAVNTAAAATRTALPVVSGLTVFGAIGDSVDFLARALSSTNRFQIISRPMVYTANGQVASISSGQEVPYAGSTLSDVNSVNNVNNSTTTLNSTTDYKKVKLELKVRPLINSDKEVTLNISQVNDTVSGSTQISAGTTAPIVSTQTLNTTITVPNRTTIVLGGLISDQEDRVQTGIPFLKDIPYIGYVFGSTKKTKTRRELIVMIQPFIIGNDVNLSEANYIERTNTSFKEGLFDKPVPVERATLPTPEEIGVLPGAK
jgi:type II secretion system protein D